MIRGAVFAFLLSLSAFGAERFTSQQFASLKADQYAAQCLRTLGTRFSCRATVGGRPHGRVFDLQNGDLGKLQIQSARHVYQGVTSYLVDGVRFQERWLFRHPNWSFRCDDRRRLVEVRYNYEGHIEMGSRWVQAICR